MSRKSLSAIVLLLLFLLLPFLFFGAQTVKRFISRALGKPAAIVVNTDQSLEPISQNWRSFAQGGEESKDMLKDVVSEIRGLNPSYIRVDHIYDHYDVVKKENGALAFNFSRLDEVVDSILRTGAKPFFSLSYMPQAIAQDGDIVNVPTDWNEWSLVVQRTVEHFSGKSQRNITNVYYEVWNEPDLFGGWKVYGDKNYLTLYSYAVTGANRAQNVNNFKIGGPATTALYKNWVVALLKNASENNLRVDFISWHRYNIDSKQFAKDLKNATKWSFQFPRFTTIEKLITEWGFDPEINSGYDGYFAAAHAVATVRQMLFGLQHSFAFEPVDGPDPKDQEYWGRWGLITHPSKGKHTKPRYTAFTMLNKMQGTMLKLTGEGTWVTGFAARDGNTIRLILSNYDAYSTHVETVPITFAGLENTTYQLKQTLFPGTATTLKETVTNGVFQTSIYMPKSSILLLELISQ